MTLDAESAAVLSPCVVPVADQAALARKRRREIIENNVPTSADEKFLLKKIAVKVEAYSFSEPSIPGPQCTVTAHTTKGDKRPQMKYDPDVPMSKEETSAWRREQRRKRNRESAAACRKKQRDRIFELEVEINEWKTKCDEALKKLRKLEGSENSVSGAEALEELVPRCSTPHTNPNHDFASQHGNVISPCPSSSPHPTQQGYVVSPCLTPKHVPSTIRSTRC